jgi:hypothetical protein
MLLETAALTEPRNLTAVRQASESYRTRASYPGRSVAFVAPIKCGFAALYPAGPCPKPGIAREKASPSTERTARVTAMLR